MSNLDEALERFHLSDLEYAGGLASHGPMGIEALESLGHQALIPAFLDIYVPRLPPASPGKAMFDGELAAARGQIERRADWVATFEARLEVALEAPLEGRAGREVVREVLQETVPGLLPGLFAAAGHGFLRTVHALRSLEREDSPLRRRELARGLAYWEARYQTLPGVPGRRSERSAGGTGLSGFFETLPLLGDPTAREGLFFEAIRRLDAFEPFVTAIEHAPTPRRDEDVGEFLAELARLAASLYLAHPESRIAYVHAVTIPVAMGDMIARLEEPDARRGAAYALQAVAALHCLFGERMQPVELGDEVRRTAESWDEIRYRAACSIQEHAIKMAEACWRADRRSPDPVFRLAASDAALQLEGSRSAGGC